MEPRHGRPPPQPRLSVLTLPCTCLLLPCLPQPDLGPGEWGVLGETDYHTPATSPLPPPRRWEWGLRSRPRSQRRPAAPGYRAQAGGPTSRTLTSFFPPARSSSTRVPQPSPRSPHRSHPKPRISGAPPLPTPPQPPCLMLAPVPASSPGHSQHPSLPLLHIPAGRPGPAGGQAGRRPGSV